MPSDPARAQSIGYLVAPWRPARGIVHSVYDSAVNLAIGSTLTSVLPAALPDGPTTVRVPEADFARLTAVRRGDSVALRAATLRTGAIPIDLRTAEVWRPAKMPTPTAGLPRRAQELAGEARRRGGAGWIPTRIAAVLSAADREESARALIGSGVGLTPAGDDALIGALAAAWFLGERRLHASLAAALSGLTGRTTDISAAFLQLAAHGHFQQPVHEAAAEVLAGERGAMGLRLMSVGATSGADCALGFAAAIDILTNDTNKVAA